MAIANDIIPTTAVAPENNRAQVVPWGLQPMEPWLIKILNERSKEYGAEPKGTLNTKYSGPRSAWGRIFSTGVSKEDIRRNRTGGFILGGAEDFKTSYGFGNENQIVIGKTANNALHTIPANAPGDLPHRPPPNLISVETELVSGQNSSFPGACRKINITFKCYNLTQLKYLVPYFFTPRIPVVVEWGWNNYDPSSLLDLTNIEELKKLFDQPVYALDRIKRSNGNYEIGMGQIMDYGYSLNDAGGYDCYSTILNTNILVEGRSTQNMSVQKYRPNTSEEDKKDKIQLKDFTEFIFDDLKSLRITTSRTFETEESRAEAEALDKFREAGSASDTKVRIDLGETFSTEGRIFKPDNRPNAPANNEEETWIRMDLIVDIINKFFTLSYIDFDGNDTGIKINKLDITDVKICAHPAIKSNSVNVLLPNQFAPRFTTKTDKDDTTASGKLSTVTIENVEYFTLFKEGVEDVILKNAYTDDFDNLQEIINPEGDSFPVFRDLPATDPNGQPMNGTYRSGYWGYLEDVFVNSKYFQNLVRTHDTLKTLLEALLQNIADSMGNICALKAIPANNSNTTYTVIDNNMTPVQTTTDANGFPIIQLNSIDSAFLKSATLSVKVSTDMASQMVLESQSGRNVPSNFGEGNNDPKKMNVSSLAAGNLLFDVAAHAITTPSNKSDESSKSKYTRLFGEGSNFYVYKKETFETQQVRRRTRAGTFQFEQERVSIIKSYILYEKDRSLMNFILGNKNDKNATYVNNNIMPGTKFDMELLGVGGILYLSQFTLANVLDQYNYKNAVWQVSTIKHKVEDKMWTTSIMAEARPLITIAPNTR